jgi:anti-sigma regulatory factor (Ser/Thr protein kinase)
MPVAADNRVQERLRLLVRSGEIFHQSLDVTATLNNVARLAVESFADLCLFDLLDERSERLFVTAFAHRDPSKEHALASVSTVFYIEEFGVHPVVQVTRTGKPFFVPVMDEATLVAHAASRQHERYMRELGYRSKIVVPVTAQGHIFGALTFVRTENESHFDEDDLAFATELGRRAGLAVANAKQFHRERNVAETLQRAFLPSRFPTHPQLRLSAHYRPGSNEADIGGDWYDAFDVGDGRIVITIGDVTGKGVDAARLMVLMRQAIRIAAFETPDAQKIAQVCNRLLLSESGERLASSFIGVLDPESRTLHYVSAGHAPPLVRHSDRRIEALEAPSAPLGALRDADFEEYSRSFEPGSMLVMYTDGIIEITRDVLAGERMLADVLASDAVMRVRNPAEFIERAIANEAPRDDIAILVVNFASAESSWQFEAADARAAYTMRDEFFQILSRASDLDSEQISTSGLIFAELIGNAVRHAPGPIGVSLEFRGRDAVLHVVDKGPGFEYDPRLPADVWSEGGRGLFLVSMLAKDVRAERIPGLGTHIAVTLPVRLRATGAD